VRGLALIGAGMLAIATACGDDDARSAKRQGSEAARTVDRVLGAAPRDCRAAPLVRRRVSAAYAPLLGSEPVWFGPYVAVDQRLAILRIPGDAPRTRDGWRVKFLWIVRANAPGPITVTGADARGRRLLFEVEGATPTEAARLDPAAADAVASGFVEFPSYVYVPGAGCFVLNADWSGGGWRLRFGAGR
jgi:hypothetical protein